MSRTDVTAAINSHLTPIVEYGTDPRGAGMFRALAGALQRGIAGTEGTTVTRRSAEFNGYAPALQSFTGMAPLGAARAVVPAGSTLADERAAGALNDTALRIFAERLKRGK